MKTRVSLVLLIGILIIGTIPFQDVAAASAPVGLGFLDPNNPSSIALAVSDDGSVIVGSSPNSNGRTEAFVWTQGTGIQGLGFFDPNVAFASSIARGVSADGSVIVGASRNSNGNGEAFVWTQGTGIQGLGFLDPNDPPPFGPNSQAFAVSADGSVIVGHSRNSNGDIEAFVWTQGTGIQGLSFLDPSLGPSSQALGVSDDGSVIVGESRNSNRDLEAFRWTQGTGIQGLGFLDPNSPFASSQALAVSDDGSVIVGQSANSNGFIEAFMWTQGTGNQGLGILGFLDPNNRGSFAAAVSGDGSVIVGQSINSNGDLEAFVWTQGTGIQGLGFLDPNNPSSIARGISADGSVIVGWSAISNSKTEAVMWTTLVCGNGVIEGNEQCDALNLPTATCDISCMTIPPSCGPGTTLNGITNQCDPDVTQAQLDAALTTIIDFEALVTQLTTELDQALAAVPNALAQRDAILTTLFEFLRIFDPNFP